MSNLATNNTQQPSSTEQQKADYIAEWLAATPIWVWLSGGVLLATFIGQIPFWLCIVIHVGGYMWWSSNNKKIKLEEARKRASAYLNTIWPEVIESSMPDEPVEEVKARAEAFRQKLIESGNPWASQIPIYEMPYDPVMYSGPLSEAWVTYRIRVADYRMQVIKDWYERKCPPEMKHLYSSGVFSKPKEETL